MPIQKKFLPPAMNNYLPRTIHLRNIHQLPLLYLLPHFLPRLRGTDKYNLLWYSTSSLPLNSHDRQSAHYRQYSYPSCLLHPSYKNLPAFDIQSQTPHHSNMVFSRPSHNQNYLRPEYGEYMFPMYSLHLNEPPS